MPVWVSHILCVCVCHWRSKYLIATQQPVCYSLIKPTSRPILKNNLQMCEENVSMQVMEAA